MPFSCPSSFSLPCPPSPLHSLLPYQFPKVSCRQRHHPWAACQECSPVWTPRLLSPLLAPFLQLPSTVREHHTEGSRLDLVSMAHSVLSLLSLPDISATCGCVSLPTINNLSGVCMSLSVLCVGGARPPVVYEPRCVSVCACVLCTCVHTCACGVSLATV